MNAGAHATLRMTEAVYNKQPTFSQGPTFELYKDGKHVRMVIRFVEVIIMQDSLR